MCIYYIPTLNLGAAYLFYSSLHLSQTCAAASASLIVSNCKSENNLNVPRDQSLIRKVAVKPLVACGKENEG